MNRTEVTHALESVMVAKGAWNDAGSDFAINANRIMRRLIHEAIANRMSAEDVARLSGYTVKRVRDLMRIYDFDPKGGKQMLSRKAAEALANNAELLGIEPSEMDLMSPLAYLPAGSELRKQMAAQSVSRVTEDDVSGNLEDRLYHAIVLKYEGMGEAWTTDESGDTLARAAAQVAVREVQHLL